MSFSSSTFLELPAAFRGPAAPLRMASVRAALLASGVFAGLQALNAGVPHRYSGIFKLDGDFLRNTHIFDKLGEATPEGLETVVLKDSFCQIVLRDGFFLTSNTGKDHRLDYSPYQNIVLSYHGVPILGNSGELFGTLCHFDMAEQQISDEEFMCLQEAGRMFAPLLCKGG